MSENTHYTETLLDADNQDRPTPRTPTQRPSGYGVIVVLAIIAIGVIAYAKWQQVPVRPEPSSRQPSVDYAALIQVHTDQASRRNMNALQAFEMDVDRVLKAHAPQLESTARAAAKEAADYRSCAKIIYYLAWDKVKQQRETEAYLHREIQPFVDPAMQALGTDVDAAVHTLNYALRRSTVQLANDLAAPGASTAGPVRTVDLDDMQRLDIQHSLRNLGFSAVGLGASVAFDAVTLGKSQLAAVLWKKVPALAARMFSKQVAKVVGSAAIAAADGPLPIGDILAVVGIVWTGYDIYTTQKAFKQDITTSLHNLLSDAQHSVHKQAVEHATALVQEYQKLQDTIGSQTLAQVARGSK